MCSALCLGQVGTLLTCLWSLVGPDPYMLSIKSGYWLSFFHLPSLPEQEECKRERGDGEQFSNSTTVGAEAVFWLPCEATTK